MCREGFFSFLILLDARLQETIEYSRLSHHIHGAGRKRILLLHLRLSGSQQCGPKDHGQIMQRHLIVGLLLVHPFWGESKSGLVEKLGLTRES